MKFAKELERELVPEWRAKYLNYKGGKKLIKQITKAVNKANGTPHSRQFPDRLYQLASSSSTKPTPNGRQAGGQTGAAVNNNTSPERPPPETSFAKRRAAASTGDLPGLTAPRPIPSTSRSEHSSLTQNSPRLQYGSFVLTPPNAAGPSPLSNEDDFALPGPATHSTPSQTGAQPRHDSSYASALSLGAPELAPSTRTDSAPQISSNNNGGQGRTRKLDRHGPLTRLLANGAGLASKTRLDPSGISLHAWDQVKKRNDDMVRFLEDELNKVEDFYELKEKQAGQRLGPLREQLHEMRSRRTEELQERRRRKDDAFDDGKGVLETAGESNGAGWIDPIRSKVFRPGPNSRALQKMANAAPAPVSKALNKTRDPDDDRRDYIRRHVDDDVPYRTAKRKLKLALQEFYRGLELLKSYAILNRTAFRKLNKKYDKAVDARGPNKFMAERVNKAWFVTSDVLDQHIRTVEDMYARYFERGNHKLAVGKLRSRKSAGDESGSAFRCGVLLGTGLVFAIQGAISGGRAALHGEDAKARLDASYLLQLYGGYFLMLYLFLLFCLSCGQWTRSKVNYPFIFEFDARHQLDWRQLAEFPCFFALLFGIVFWFNFSGYGEPGLYLWWPVILIGVTAAIIFLPLPVLRHRSRLWFVSSHWRLLMAGIYPVEFRDFFLGDIYCSLSYAVCNIELFFCLYRGDIFDNPEQCDSSHSRLMGFLTTLPPIWRALQCIRRYYDTRNFFPHLVNLGKYCMTIMSAVALSMYRIRGIPSNLALFIALSTVNGVYVSFWDLFMDFSLMQGCSKKNFLLRDILAFKRRWWYYAIIVLDPIFRFGWIFYAIFIHNVQHSALVGFLVAAAEVTRRGAWTLFRVENEHVGNVKLYKASRDVPLPYRIEPLLAVESEGEGEGEGESAGEESSSSSTRRKITRRKFARDHQRRPPPPPQPQPHVQVRGEDASSTTGREEEGGGGAARRTTRAAGVAASAAAVRGLGRILADAHKQDFEKKRRVRGGRDTGGSGVAGPDDEDDDEDDDGDSEEDQDDEEEETMDGRV